jgi:multiple sugar transport system ATP-binding protein
MAALEFKNLSKLYKGGAVGVRDLNIEVLEGELMVLVGPSGSGKSTTLRLAAGLETPTAGEVYIGGKLANDIAPRDRDIAMVFQDYALYPHLNVEQNLGFGLRMRGAGKGETRERVMRASQMLGIDSLLRRKPRELSGGQRQRVALGRALVRDPKVFLFDEPLSNLDAALRVQLRREIKDIHRTLGATMIYVTHDQGEAMAIGRRIAVMNDGAVEQVGTPAQIYTEPSSRFVAQFFGSPPMNLAERLARPWREGLEVEFGGASLFFKTAPEAQSGVSRKVLLGFRPEDITLGDAFEADSLVGRARVLSVEAMGSETLVFLEDGALRPAARLLGHADIEPGADIGYGVPRARLHLFDEKTGGRIRVD